MAGASGARLRLSHSSFDHALIGVADLEAARQAFERLGFTTTPRGRHIGWGTANYCIMFGDDYLELLGIVDAAQFTNNLDSFLAASGQGLLGLSFASDDLDGLAEKFGGQPSDLKRLLELPEGTVEPRFRLFHPPAGTLPGLAGFFCHHLTPDLMRRPAWLVHGNGATAIAWATLAVSDVTAAVQSYGRIFDRVEGADVILKGGRLRLVEAEDHQGLIELAVRVADLGHAADYLKRAEIPFERGAHGLAIDPASACGAALMLVP